MPNENTQLQGKTFPLGLVSMQGLLAYRQNAYTTGAAGYEAVEVIRVSGTSDILDITNTSTTVTAVAASVCPKGMRPYVMAAQMQVMGTTGWSNTSPTAGSVPSIYLQDSISGMPLLAVPFAALDSNAMVMVPQSETRVPIFLGEAALTNIVGAPAATFTYVPSTGVITASATMFVANVGVGSIAEVVKGGGIGQKATITAITATTVTVSPAFTSAVNDHASSLKDSVIAVHAQTVKTATDTTHSTIQNGGGTGFTANAFDAGLNVMGVIGTGAGQVRQIIANSTAGALTYNGALSTNFDTTTSMLAITDNVGVGEVIQCGMGSFNPVTSNYNYTTNVGAGLNWVVNDQAGTARVGDNIRWAIWVWFGQ